MDPIMEPVPDRPSRAFQAVVSFRMPSTSPVPPVAIVGAGAMGTALARGVVANGHRVEAVLSRTPASAQALAKRVDAPVASAEKRALPNSVRRVLICVPDDAIVGVAEALAKVDHSWPDTFVAHTSGEKSAAALAPLREQGAATLSFHPLQTFTAETPPAAFEDIIVGLQGDDLAVEAGEALARLLGGRPVRLTAEQKARYHAAAALASNGLVALLAVVEELLPEAKEEDDPPAINWVAPLVERTWTHLKRSSPEGALTGPVARGDQGTVEGHLDALADETPHLVPLYAALSTEMVRVAVRSGRLSGNQAETLLDLLRASADATTDEGHGASDPSH